MDDDTKGLIKGLSDAIPLGPHPDPHAEWIQVRLDFVQRAIDHIERLRADAARWRYINERNNIWRRDDRDKPCSLLCVVLPYGADLSCRATREDAIDAAMLAELAGDG